MGYQGIDSWRAVYAPMLRLLDGNPDPVRFDENWDWDKDQLDPWGTTTPTDVQDREGPGDDEPDVLPTLKQAPSYNFTFPREADPGRAQADRWAAERGVNPGRTDGGMGHLFDMAKSFIGTPYVFGAAGPEAFDCSGFVQYLYSRAFGVALPHQALQQAQVTKKVGRKDLQPGDLIFYSYGRLGGAIDHVEIYMGGNKQIGTSNPAEDLDIDEIDWDNVAQLGRVVSSSIPARSGGNRSVDPMLGKPKFKTVQKPVENDSSNAPAMLTGDYGAASFSTVLSELLAGDTAESIRQVKLPKKGLGGPNASIKRQLYRGFADAGREDLARMVGTRDFNAWIGQESGWRVDVTSPANNHGKANDGLFQVWRGHDFNSNGQVAQMSPYEQAQLVAKYFSHLTPEDIRRYAAEIRSGSYKGWG